MVYKTFLCEKKFNEKKRVSFYTVQFHDIVYFCRYEASIADMASEVKDKNDMLKELVIKITKFIEALQVGCIVPLQGGT